MLYKYIENQNEYEIDLSQAIKKGFEIKFKSSLNEK
jgi:hypothetical protein